MAVISKGTPGVGLAGLSCDGTGDEVAWAASALVAGVDGFADAEEVCFGILLSREGG